MLYTKEFYELMDFFEKSGLKTVYTGAEIKREPKELWPKKQYYTNGKVNDFFKMFLAGYQLGKII